MTHVGTVWHTTGMDITDYTTETAIQAATDEVFQRCNGDHDRDCCWHAVMAIAENTWESDYTYDGDPCLVDNARDLVDNSCKC